MKKLFLFLFVAIAVQVKAQEELINDAYYYRGELLTLQVNYNAFFVTSYGNVDLGTIFQQYGYAIDTLNEGVENDERDSNLVWTLVKINNATLNLSSYNDLRSALKNNHHLIIEPVLGNEDVRPLNIYFYVKLKDVGDTTILDSVASSVNAPILKQVPFMPRWFELKSDTNSLGNSLEMANYFFQTGLFSNIDPGFTFNFSTACVSDPEFINNKQWGLSNNTNPNLDVNACQAWGITKGSNAVKVAIVDEYNILPSPDFANISSLSYDAVLMQPGAPNQGGHAVPVASVIGAAHNSVMLAGVAPNTTLVPVSHDIYFINSTKDCAELASGISWAWTPVSQGGAGVDIVNCSWWDDGNYFTVNNQNTSLLEGAIEDALTKGRDNKGCIVAIATGNNGISTVGYPARAKIPGIIAVGNMGESGSRFPTSNYGTELDIVGPGENIPAITVTPSTIGYVDGTSYATPHVSGAAALALAENDCLSGEDVKTIIESTAQKVGGYTYFNLGSFRPNGTWNNEMGYGLLDAHAVVATAQAMKKAGKDLYIKDTPFDFGIQPNSYSGPMWVSDDIWIRNNHVLPIVEEHETPVYGSSPVTVYVKIRNKGCSISSGNEQVVLYWASSSAGVNWPSPWEGGVYMPGSNNTVLMGSPICTLQIPQIGAGHSKILYHTQWQLPNPNSYINGLTNNEHFCILARILSDVNDPIVNEVQNLSGALNGNIRHNNNIALKNITIYQAPPEEGNATAVAGVGNFGDDDVDVYLEFIAGAEEGHYLTDEAEVRIKMDSVTWDKWQAGGECGEGFVVLNNGDDKTILAGGPYVRLDGLHYDSVDFSHIAVEVNFLTEESSEKQIFYYDLIEKDSVDSSVINGVRFIVHKPERGEADMFVAEGNYNNSSQQQGLDLNAEDINEPAAYRWYTSDTTFVDSGRVVSVNPPQNTTYLLEVTAEEDGFKDYATVSVPAQPQSWISSMSPNPATSSVTVGYHLGSSVQNAEVRIVSANNPGAVLITSTLNINQTSKNINISSLSPGIYIVNLYCDSNNQDGEQLVIQ
jgi:hypothetical protein